MSTETVSRMLGPAIEYAGRGWHVVALHHVLPDGRCSCPKGERCAQRNRGKHPRIGNDWQHKVTTDEETIEAWWTKWPDANLGVQLGPKSGIVDIEFDDAEGEEMAKKLFGECYTPTFKSGRSTHRLFKWSDDFVGLKNTEHRYGLEFRLGVNGGEQSVFPPSKHWSGATYQWIDGLSPDAVDVQEVPPHVATLLWNDIEGEAFKQNGQSARSAEHWDRILGGSSEGSRNDDACSLIGRLLFDLRDPYDADSIARQWVLVKAWNAQNKPPLDEDELKSKFLGILRKHRQNRTNENYSQTFAPERSGDPIEASEIVPNWRLVIVESRPRTYRLYSPIWSLKAPQGYIELTAAEMHNPDAIRKQALEQADVWVNRGFNTKWQGSKEEKALARQLIETAEYQQAPLEDKRDLVIAAALWDKLVSAKHLEEGKEPPTDGRPWKDKDGRILFGFNHVWEPMARFDDRVKRKELAAVLNLLGVEDEIGGTRDKRRRLKVISPESISNLKAQIGLAE